MTRLSPLFLVVIAAGLAGCSDWYLRGTRTDAVAIESAHVSGGGAPRLSRALTRELGYNGVTMTSRSKAQATIELTDETFDRRVLSVDPDSGKVREVELGLEVGFTVRGKDGSLLLAPERLSWTQDYIFDESSLLGTSEKASIIQRELSEDAAQTILLRLEALELPPSE